MKSLIDKDKFVRYSYRLRELRDKAIDANFLRMLNSKNFSRAKRNRFSIAFQRKLKKGTSKTKIVRRCVITGRARSSLRCLGISRIKIKELVRDSKISNLRKKTW